MGHFFKKSRTYISNLSGKLKVKMVLLNNFIKTSEQLSILAFKTCVVIFLKVHAFFLLRLLNYFSISNTEASVKANTVILFLINMILGWFLYLKIAFLAGLPFHLIYLLGKTFGSIL